MNFFEGALTLATGGTYQLGKALVEGVIDLAPKPEVEDPLAVPTLDDPATSAAIQAEQDAARKRTGRGLAGNILSGGTSAGQGTVSRRTLLGR